MSEDATEFHRREDHGMRHGPLEVDLYGLSCHSMKPEHMPCAVVSTISAAEGHLSCIIDHNVCVTAALLGSTTV